MPADPNEWTLSEQPALTLLQGLGYTFLPPADLAPLRLGPRSAVLEGPLRAALRRLNPWLSEDNLSRALRAITAIEAPNVMERNRAAYELIVGGVNVRQADLGPHDLTARFVDFDDVGANAFHVARQLRVQGGAHDIIFDAVAFVNGLPLAVIECKSPTISNPIPAAVEQLRRYQDLGDGRGQGAPLAFSHAQFLIAVCGEQAVYGAVGTGGRGYATFPESCPPIAGKDLADLSGGFARAQEVLLWSLLRPESLLEFARHLVAFEQEDGQLVKKLARHQQRVAIDQAVRRIQSGASPTERGGVIWHTQGSGKSLTMLWLAQKLRQASLGLGNPTLVVVTDRTDLDDQITATFRRAGLRPPHQANSVADLRASLQRAERGATLLTTVQKFQGVAVGETLNESRDVYVLVDEAHRSQYGPLAARMRQALPNATFIAFTGTPIDKKSKSTLQTFGPYIHTYPLDAAVRDGATVPIFYEARDLERFGVEGRTLDVLFDRYFAEYGEDEREAIRARYANAETLAGAPRRVREIALDIADHYARAIEPNGLKAQLVAVNRETAARYWQELRDLGAPEGAVVFTAQDSDKAHLAAHHTTKAQQRTLIRRFKDPSDPLKFLIVVDMLLTGFDAPIEGALYLDAPLREHNLLQAIARVNRTYDNKTAGLVVDYWGVGGLLRDALAMFDDGELGDPLPPKHAELPRLEAWHAAALRFFEGVAPDDWEALIAVLEPEDVRARFGAAFKAFAQSLNILYPDPAALKYEADFRWLGAVRQMAALRFRNPTLDLGGEDVPDKVRKLIEEYVSASGVVQLLAPVSILSGEFEAALERLGSNRARASEMTQAIRHELNVREHENPAYYRSLRERLEDIIERRRQARLSEAEELRLLFEALHDVREGTRRAARDLDLSETAFAFYGALEDTTEPERAVQLARDIEAALCALIVVDWTAKEDVRREMRRALRRLLLGAGVPREAADARIAQLLDVATVRLRR